MDENKGLKDITQKFEVQVNREDQANYKNVCLEMCQKYLGGNWNLLNVGDIQVKRLTGGMTNLVYHCKIGDHLQEQDSVPQEVVVRLYGMRIDMITLEKKVETLEENFKLILCSEAGIGPKVYGVHQDGVVQKYYQHKLLKEEDLLDKDLLNQLAVKLARFHAIKAPIDREKNYYRDLVVSYGREFSKQFESKNKLFEKYNCKTLLESDLRPEIDWMLKMFANFDFPVVLVHQDFRFGNIMVTEEEGIVLVDFDNSCYTYRGLDFAMLFMESIEVKENTFAFKDESIVRQFIGKYVAESAVIYGKQYMDNKINSVDNILMETKWMSLFNLVVLTMALIMNEIYKLPIDESTCFPLANNLFEKFLAFKKLDEFRN